MAALAAALIGSGTSKCGWPMLRFTGSLRLRARSNTLRIPETSMLRVRSAIQWSYIGVSARTASWVLDGIISNRGKGETAGGRTALQGRPIAHDRADGPQEPSYSR